MGALKYEGSPDIKDIIKKAAELGAMALIKEGNNYIQSENQQYIMRQQEKETARNHGAENQ